MRLKSTPLLCLLLILAGLTNCSPRAEKAATTTPIHFEIEETTIADIHQAFREGNCTCEQLVSTYLQRIERYDQPTKLNAIVVINSEALATARALDEEYRKSKKLRQLHCIPLIVKDNYNTIGLQTAAGSLAMKGFIPGEDAYQVRVLKEAGAIVLAKSNMAEWAFSPMVTISSIAGETLNPYNLEHVPAGSSGGTAAAVAANMGTVGLGSDTGNSIRSTLGLTSRHGIVPLYLRNDVGGPMARTVEDATRILEIIAGYDSADPVTRYSQGKVPQSYTRFLDKDGLKGARIGVLRTLSEKNPDPQVKALFEQAIADLKKLGAVIVDPIDIAGFDSLRKDQWCDVFQEDINAYLASAGKKVPVKNLQEIVASGKYSPYIEENLKYFLEHQDSQNNSSHTCSDPFTDPRRIAFREAIEQAMDQHQLGAIIYPTWNNPPAKVGDLKGYKGDNSQVIAPHTGQPAFSVPMGYTYDNLPAGLQFLGRMFDEPTLIRYTYSYEQGTRHRKPPVQFSEQKVGK
jgi:Asp-tRNA(Asn)/Glu-tRNA(Gln) amidotransferase A subunit family amidase